MKPIHELDLPSIKDNTPEGLRELISYRTWSQNTMGYSDSKTFLLKGSSTDENLYLKVNSTGSPDRLSHEKDKLTWLDGKISVPRVLYYERSSGLEYLLLSEVPGQNAVNAGYELEKTLVLTADGLNSIHSIAIDDCPFDCSLDIRLGEAAQRVRLGVVREDDFEERYRGKTSAELLEECLRERPEGEDLVFTHGDYCLPNIVLHQDRVSGFIDLARSGIADRYQDIALAYRSIIHNFHEVEYAELFLKHYGVAPIDCSKIEYYILLDELF